MLYLILIIVLLAVIAAGIMNRSQDKEIAKILDNGQPKPEVTREWLLENTEIGGLLKFFLFCVVVGCFAAAVREMAAFGTPFVAVAYVPFILLAIITVIAFARRDRDAVFLAKAYMIICLVTNLMSLLAGIEAATVIAIGVNILWLLFLIFSENVNDVCPVEYRKTSIRGWVLVGLFVLAELAIIAYFASLAI